jgi:hypothetical protein
MDDGKAILGESWSALLSAIAKAEHPEILRLQLAVCLDSVTSAAANPPSPAGERGGDPHPGGADRDGCTRARDYTPSEDHLRDLAQALRKASTSRPRHARRTPAALRRLSEAASDRQAAHWAWDAARREINAIEKDRPQDARGFWRLLTANMAQLALDVPVRHAPDEFRNLGGALPRFAGVPGKES